MLGGVPEYAVPSFESGYLLEMRYTVLLSISRDKATLLTSVANRSQATIIHKSRGLARRGWLAPAAERCVLLTITQTGSVSSLYPY